MNSGQEGRRDGKNEDHVHEAHSTTILFRLILLLRLLILLLLLLLLLFLLLLLLLLFLLFCKQPRNPSEASRLHARVGASFGGRQLRATARGKDGHGNSRVEVGTCNSSKIVKSSTNRNKSNNSTNSSSNNKNSNNSKNSRVEVGACPQQSAGLGVYMDYGAWGL